MPYDPATGILSRKEFAELVTAPYGEARKTIQKRDPFWGREPGEEIEFRITGSSRLRGVAFVKAANMTEAEKKADALTEHDFDWGGYGGSHGIDIEKVEVND